MILSDAPPRYSNSENPACSVPIIVAARQASKKSCSVLILEQLIVDRLHACHPDSFVFSQTGHIPISTQGLTSNSVLSDQTNPGSPNSFTDFMSSANCSLLVSSLSRSAELLDLPLCGLSINQVPVLAVAISVSSGLKTQMVALRRTPPEITASAVCITIS